MAQLGLKASRYLARVDGLRGKSTRSRTSADQFDFERPPKLNRALVHDLATGRYIQEHAPVLIVGPCGTGKSHLAHTAVRCSELRNPAGTPVIFQSGTYQPDPTSRWMSSGATDKQGNIAVGYNTFGPTVSKVRYRFTDRFATSLG